MAISSALGSSALLPAGLGFRNVLINADFRINQRSYASAANLASGAYGFDRWKSSFTNTTLTFTSAPQGQIVTINSGGSIKQIVERENVSAGTYILSWTGTATGRVYNTGATAPSYAASPLVVTLDGLANVEVEFTASGGTQTLWKPQLEQNRQPTPFEQRPYGVELALCQRYYFRIIATSAYGVLADGGAGDTTSTFMFTPAPVVMRVRPTSVESSGIVLNDIQAAYACNAATLDTTLSNARLPAAGVAATSSVLVPAKRYLLLGNNNVNGYIGFSAEL